MTVPAKIVRSGRKTIALTVNNRAELIVKAPFDVGEDVINDTIRRKSAWIEEKQRIARTFYEKYPQSLFKAGESHMYLGNYYMLDYAEVTETVLDGNKILLPQDNQTNAERLLKSWYKQQAGTLLNERVDYYSNKIGAEYSALRLSDSKSRWGSCGADKKIFINWRIIMCPLFVLDYVAVRGLCRLKHKNRGGDFWRTVATVMPDYKEAQIWLGQNGGLLNTF